MRQTGEREPVITIDGPAGAGKSTVARELARRLGLRHVSTGALYRALSWAVREAGVKPGDAEGLAAVLDRTAVELVGDRVLVDGRDVTDEIRTPEISALTSLLTKLERVRDKMTPLQRALAAPGGVVLEGRDTGSVVWPEAEVKFYLDASLDVRARRRQADLRAQGVEMELEAVEQDVAMRDEQDTRRVLAPLVKPAGAVVVDSTALNLDEVVEVMRRAVEQIGVLYAALKGPAVALMRLLFRLEVSGRQHVPRTGPVLLVSNHVSVLDPPVVGGASPRELHFLAKEELFHVPVLGRLIRALNSRPVKRDGSDTRALKTGLRLLEEGRALLVFPEGTRGVEGRLGEGKPGVGMLAVMSGATVVPVYVSGTGRALPPGRSLPRPAKVRVSFGPPLVFQSDEGEGRKERYREATRDIMSAIARLMGRPSAAIVESRR